MEPQHAGTGWEGDGKGIPLEPKSKKEAEILFP